MLIAILTFIATAFVAGNNLSACVGPAIGSRILSKKHAVLVGIVGLILGLLTQGEVMNGSVNLLFPAFTSTLRVELLLTASLIFLFAHIFKAPVSLTVVLTNLLVGLSLFQPSAAESLKTAFIITWAVIPIASLAFTYVIIKLFSFFFVGNVWTRLQTAKIVTLLLSVTASYVLGANTLGLIVAIGGYPSTLLVAVVAVVFGALFLSGGEIHRLSQELFYLKYQNAAASLAATTILVELATLFGLPASNTMALSSAILGAGLSYKTKFLSLKPFLTTVSCWITVFLLSLLIGVILSLKLF